MARKSRQLIAEYAEHRIAIEGIDPSIDGGRFPARAVAGRPFAIRADVFGEGHDEVRAALLVWKPGDRKPVEHPMEFLVNDRWEAVVTPEAPGDLFYTVIGWRDDWGFWAHGTQKKIAAGLNVDVEFQEGIEIVQRAIPDAPRARRKELRALANAGDIRALLVPEAMALMHELGPRGNLTRHPVDHPLAVDPPFAAFSSWYELFPRSWGKDGAHGTLRDVIDRLDYVTDLGFDVLYFPPIHPIGKTNRKGKNNTLTPADDDVGVPYAIGSEEGGHRDIHPQLGTHEDFRALVEAANARGVEIAIDFAIQASPDHPWIKEHPGWFEWRPDGSIRYAENPPKKYEDIVNVDFYQKESIPALWEELRDVVLFWIGQGVRIFRVDNPHTKPFPFWEWMIGEVRAEHPDTVFLAEAFTRPKVMGRLAKVGFNQSYSYFTWRNEKAELQEYMTELTTGPTSRVMRPNFFVNTPDINPRYLQSAGRPGFRIRAVLAATLAGNWGMYNGFEICEAGALAGKEEYLDSEKYQLRRWDFDIEGNIKDDVRMLNRLRREHPALQDIHTLRFFNAFDDRVLYYGKFDEGSGDYLLFHVLMDPHQGATFGFELPLWEFGLDDGASMQVQDMIHGNDFTWHGKMHELTLDPHQRPYAIWRLTPPGTGLGGTA